MLDLLIRGLSRILVPMFLFGMAGSALVVAVTLVRDVRDFFADDPEPTSARDNLS